MVLEHPDAVFVSRAPQAHLRTLSKRLVSLRATAPQKNSQRAVKLPLDAAQAEKYVAISRAFEARLSELYKRAPDDKELPNIDTEAWDDEELLKEGRELESGEHAEQRVCCSVYSCTLFNGTSCLKGPRDAEMSCRDGQKRIRRSQPLWKTPMWSERSMGDA
jgi:hypothetical protein